MCLLRKFIYSIAFCMNSNKVEMQLNKNGHSMDLYQGWVQISGVKPLQLEDHIHTTDRWNVTYEMGRWSETNSGFHCIQRSGEPENMEVDLWRRRRRAPEAFRQNVQDMVWKIRSRRFLLMPGHALIIDDIVRAIIQQVPFFWQLWSFQESSTQHNKLFCTILGKLNWCIHIPEMCLMN